MKDDKNNRFIADVHLGRLAKCLRLPGFDVWYDNNVTPAILIEKAALENRVLLSKATGFAQQASVHFLQIESSNSLEQLQQVLIHFQLTNALQPFTRCLICNGQLQPVSKETIAEKLLPNTKEAFFRFWQCNTCKRTYWEGSHYERMLQIVEKIKKFED